MQQFFICPNCGELVLHEKAEIAPFIDSIPICPKCDNYILPSEEELAKAISIRQPWAYLILAGIKPIENRTWKLPEKHKGKRVLVHTGAKPVGELPQLLTPDQSFYIVQKADRMPPYVKDMDFSAIIGSVEIVDCIQNSNSIWAEKAEEYNSEIHDHIPRIYNWVLKNPVLFEKPILNVKGKLSFFTPEIL